jgi:hypothetical protein
MLEADKANDDDGEEPEERVLMMETAGSAALPSTTTEAGADKTTDGSTTVDPLPRCISRPLHEASYMNQLGVKVQREVGSG